MSNSGLRRLIQSGPHLVGEIERLSSGIQHVPPEERLTYFELDAWFSAADRAIENAFGLNSDESKDWNKFLERRYKRDEAWAIELARATTRTPERTREYHLKTLTNDIYEAIGLLTKFDLVTPEGKKPGPGERLDKMPLVTVFVALDMELKILVKRWALKGSFPHLVWTGQLQSTRISVLCPGEMGRVPAAIATTIFLYNTKPNLIIVTGIAGGFKSEGVNLGDVIVATSIIDSAIMKVREKKGKREFMPEFRPKELPIDDRIKNYLRSGSFDIRRWEQKVIDDEEWPKGVRPKIEYGPLASTDEVVSSYKWIELLNKAWPKLLGIEMEAGGVCRAAQIFGLQAAVVRGVSDHANPAKADDEWRTRAMKTAAHLLENIDYKLILGSS